MTLDVGEGGYPIGQVLCTYVVNSVSAWVPSVFDRIPYNLKKDDNNKNHYDQKIFVGVLYLQSVMYVKAETPANKELNL